MYSQVYCTVWDRHNTETREEDKLTTIPSQKLSRVMVKEGNDGGDGMYNWSYKVSSFMGPILCGYKCWHAVSF